MSHKCDLDSVDTEGNSLLHLAILRGDTFAASFLIKNGCNTNLARHSTQERPLHLVASYNPSQVYVQYCTLLVQFYIYTCTFIYSARLSRATYIHVLTVVYIIHACMLTIRIHIKPLYTTPSSHHLMYRCTCIWYMNNYVHRSRYNMYMYIQYL